VEPGNLLIGVITAIVVGVGMVLGALVPESHHLDSDRRAPWWPHRRCHLHLARRAGDPAMLIVAAFAWFANQLARVVAERRNLQRWQWMA
jgi:hypothetical protein